MWKISQPPKRGPLTSHCWRLPSAVRIKAPLRVPTRTRTLLIFSPLLRANGLFPPPCGGGFGAFPSPLWGRVRGFSPPLVGEGSGLFPPPYGGGLGWGDTTPWFHCLDTPHPSPPPQGRAGLVR